MTAKIEIDDTYLKRMVKTKAAIDMAGQSDLIKPTETNLFINVLPNGKIVGVTKIVSGWHIEQYVWDCVLPSLSKQYKVCIIFVLVDERIAYVGSFNQVNKLFRILKPGNCFNGSKPCYKFETLRVLRCYENLKVPDIMKLIDVME